MSLHQLRFGPFILEDEPMRLRRGAASIQLRPKSLEVLQYLAERPGQIVSKEELFKRVWSGRVVSDSGLRLCVREIRTALGDNVQTPHYLETIVGRGYRFLEGRDGRALFADSVGPIVGRISELRRLEDCYQLAVDGDRQFVLLSGEPGIGKTTLLKSFLDSVSEHSTIRIIQGQCIVHYGKSEAYGPVFDAIVHQCQSRDSAELIRILKRYAPGWLLQLPGLIDPFELERLQSQVEGMTSERMTREFCQVIEELTKQGPLIIAIEDLHWADVSTTDLLATLAEHPLPSLLVLGTYRPADAVLYAKGLRNVVKELKGRDLCEEIALEYLSREDVATYLAERLGGAVSSELTTQIYQRSNGNPLFMVNLVEDLIRKQMLSRQEEGWSADSQVQNPMTVLPESLRSLISRRLEALPNEQQLILEHASVAGLDFAAATLTSSLEKDGNDIDRQCEALSTQGQFIESNGVEQWPNGTTSSRYRFQHPLYLEVLYEEIGEARRIQAHRLIGQCLETGYGDRTNEIAVELAMHFNRGRDAERAIRYHKLAAEQAQSRHAYRESIDQFKFALDTLKQLPENNERAQQELELLSLLGSDQIAAEGYGAPEVEQTFNRAQVLCEQLEDKSHRAIVLWNLAGYRMARAELVQSHSLIEQFVELAKASRDGDLDLMGHDAQAQQLFFEGKFMPAHLQAEQVCTRYNVKQHSHLANTYSQEDPGMVCASIDTLLLWLLGYPDQSRDRLQTVQTLTKELANPHSSAFGLIFTIFTSQLHHDPTMTQQRADELIQISTEHALPWLSLGEILKGWSMAQQTADSEQLDLIKNGLRRWREAGTEIAVPYCLGLLAETHQVLGRIEDAQAAVEEALSLVEKNKERWFESELHRLQGVLILEQDSNKDEAAARCFNQALKVARKQQAKSLELRAALSLSRLLVHRGQSEQVRELLAPIVSFFTEGFEAEEIQEAKGFLIVN